MLGTIFSSLYSTISALVISIPVNNALGLVYVVLDGLSRLLLMIFGSGSGTTGGGLFGGGLFGGGFF